jgi:hypothetical protein
MGAQSCDPDYAGGIDRRIMVQDGPDKMWDAIQKLSKKQKELEAWLKWQSSCLASRKPWRQTLVPTKTKWKKKYIYLLMYSCMHFTTCIQWWTMSPWTVPLSTKLYQHLSHQPLPQLEFKSNFQYSFHNFFWHRASLCSPGWFRAYDLPT